MRLHVFAFAVVFSASLMMRAQATCDTALVKSTYNSFSSDHLDWRLATFVSETEYNDIKHDQGASAVIYGIPVGESYGDYQRHVSEKIHDYHESLTRSQARNIMWTGLDESSPSDYAKCLEAQVFESPGLHIAVQSATASDIFILAKWTPQGPNSPTQIHPQWIYRDRANRKGGPVRLPDTLRNL